MNKISVKSSDMMAKWRMMLSEIKNYDGNKKWKREREK